jgi:hypothetical protein
MVLGLNSPTSGSVTVDGHDFRDLSRGLRHVGALPGAGDDQVLGLARILAVKSGSLLAFHVLDCCQVTPRWCRIRRTVSTLIASTWPAVTR